MVVAVCLLSAESRAHYATNDAAVQVHTSSTDVSQEKLSDRFKNSDFVHPSVSSTAVSFLKIKRFKTDKTLKPIELHAVVHGDVNHSIILKRVFFKTRKTNLIFPFHNFW